eukprot:665276-Pleurochrysis_carterae.AAC.2
MRSTVSCAQGHTCMVSARARLHDAPRPKAGAYVQTWARLQVSVRWRRTRDREPSRAERRVARRIVAFMLSTATLFRGWNGCAAWSRGA